MLAAIEYKDVLLTQFYLNKDNMTIHRNQDGYYGRYKKHDVVVPFKLSGSKSGNNYGGIHIPGTRSTISVPWLLTVLRGVPFKDGQVIDHINGDTSDNSASNLRVVSTQINCKNRKIRKDSSTGYTGISFNQSSNSYLVRRSIKGKRIYLGSRNTLEEAIKLLNTVEGISKEDGYTDRHLQKSATTIPEGSTFKQMEAVGS